jgi:hypothetical protein
MTCAAPGFAPGACRSRVPANDHRGRLART